MPPSHDPKFKEIRPNHLPLTNIKKKKSPNGFAIYFTKYRAILKREFPNYTPQQIMREAGRRWRKSPVELKNSFLKYAAEEKSIKDHDSAQMAVPPSPLTNIIDSTKSMSEEDEAFYEYIRPES